MFRGVGADYFTLAAWFWFLGVITVLSEVRNLRKMRNFGQYFPIFFLACRLEL